MRRSLADWLRWQESLNPREIDLGLERVRTVADRLPIAPPAGAVFTVAGTNGKGSTVAWLSRLLTAGGHRVGVYTSPHLVRYNERISVAGSPVGDEALIEAFEQTEAARGSLPLTYFEFGTLAALAIFSARKCSAWVLEVGLGGRLDAVNVVAPDFSLITTIGLDHQDWLGDSVEEIAAEKAGIMRGTAPAFYGDADPPAALLDRAAALGTRLYRYGRDYAIEATDTGWSWHGTTNRLEELDLPPLADDVELRNAALAMAAIEQFDPALLTRANARHAGSRPRPPGRFQVVHGERQWILDVAHNAQAARVLRERLKRLAGPRPSVAVIGMFADKAVEEFARELAPCVDRWVATAVEGARGTTAAETGSRVARATGQPVDCAETPGDAFEAAVGLTAAGGRIVCCGSFQVVGPAIEWLGLY